MEVKFTDNSVRVLSKMTDITEGVLEEVMGELESQVKRNTPVGRVHGGELKNSWTHHVLQDGDEYTAILGSPLERALWVEFGTGEYALPQSGKGGRKGGWYIPVGEGDGFISEVVAKKYGFTIRKGKDGKKWVFTLGMKPKRPLYHAYTRLKNRMIRRIQSVFKGGLK